MSFLYCLVKYDFSMFVIFYIRPFRYEDSYIAIIINRLIRSTL